MRCPKCASKELQVKNTRHLNPRYVWRQRACLDCMHKFSTWETTQDPKIRSRALQVLIKLQQHLEELE
ncbi:MAG: hypothetical protein OXC42_01425 [Gammaproteobacteria bacterium]|nr:hypothetical protein [Gammaproteobacteria bacterium]